MAKTVKDSLYLDEESYYFIKTEEDAGRLNKQKFYNLAIQKEVERRQQEKKLLESMRMEEVKR
ncbi:hypothetical protein I2I11_04155 [Pontibacter sp. 172403-2]|uniref:hypothetical protein n=1 Tax=Pontibacter rufus TaxID=2791028 RepID=UPI0018AFF090|nr:hypothetical protein [Pontibacter sp. 172403-2]MBF9252477.1 hypothetical protein [Pontibacter sp. 172403-2]